MPNLWGDADFSFRNSKNDVGLQVADFVSGTLAYMFDNHKVSDDTPNYLEVLKSQLIRFELYPKTYEKYILEKHAIVEDYDEMIAKLCFAQAVKFLECYSDDDNSEAQGQFIVLK